MVLSANVCVCECSDHVFSTRDEWNTSLLLHTSTHMHIILLLLVHALSIISQSLNCNRANVSINFKRCDCPIAWHTFLSKCRIYVALHTFTTHFIRTQPAVWDGHDIVDGGRMSSIKRPPHFNSSNRVAAEKARIKETQSIFFLYFLHNFYIHPCG